MRVKIFFVAVLLLSMEVSFAQNVDTALKIEEYGRGSVVLKWENPERLSKDDYISRYFTRVKSLEICGELEAYSITARGEMLKVEYTSERAAEIAYRRLIGMLKVDRRGLIRKRQVMVLPTCHIVDYCDSQIDEAELLDTDEWIPIEKLTNQLERVSEGWSSVAVLKLNNKADWFVESPILKRHFSAIESRDYYTFDQLSKLGAVARTRNLTLVLELTPHLCERFEAAVGHTALSLEGESVMVSLVNEMLAAVSDVVVRLRVPQSRYTEKLAKLKNKRFELILE